MENPNLITPPETPLDNDHRDYSADERLHEVLAIFDEAIYNLMAAIVPISIRIKASVITGTPPWTKNNVADYLDGQDEIVINIHSVGMGEAGHVYLTTVMNKDMNRVLSEGDVEIKGWHLVHYLHKAAEIAKR